LKPPRVRLSTALTTAWRAADSIGQTRSRTAGRSTGGQYSPPLLARGQSVGHESQRKHRRAPASPCVRRAFPAVADIADSSAEGRFGDSSLAADGAQLCAGDARLLRLVRQRRPAQHPSSAPRGAPQPAALPHTDLPTRAPCGDARYV